MSTRTLLVAALVLALPAISAIGLPDPGQSAPFATVETSGPATSSTLDVPIAGFSSLTLHARATDSILGATDLARVIDAQGATLLRVWEDNYVIRATDPSSVAGSVVLSEGTHPTWHRIAIGLDQGRFLVGADAGPRVLVESLVAGAAARLVALPGPSSVSFFGLRVGEPPAHENLFAAPLAGVPGWRVAATGVPDYSGVHELTAADGHGDPGVIQVSGSAVAGGLAYLAYAPPIPAARFEVGISFRAQSVEPLTVPSGQSVLACRDGAGSLLWSLDLALSPVGYTLVLTRPDALPVHASPTYVSLAWHTVVARVEASGATFTFDGRHAWAAPSSLPGPCVDFGMGDLSPREHLDRGGGVMRFDDFTWRPLD